MPQSLHKALCLPVTLYNAWKVVKLKNSAGGIDGLSVAAFEEDLKVNLERLRRDLIDKVWNPDPYLRVEIEKKGKEETRKLGLLSVRDKIVQQAVKSLIEPRMEKLFLNNSYGYRPGKGPVKAINRMMFLYGQVKNGFVAKLDIDDYFDTIKHERLFAGLKDLLKDDEVVRLIELCVKTGAVTKQLTWKEMDKGVHQGAVLSPLLANFYLHPFDRFVVSKAPYYVRYADDFCVVAATKEQLEELIRTIQEELQKEFSLRLNEPVIADLETGVEFLGITVKRSGLALSEKKKKDLEERVDAITFHENKLSEKSKETLQGIKNYYARLLAPSYIKELDGRLILRIHGLVKTHAGSIPNKTTLATHLKEIDFFADETNLSKPVLIKEFVETYLKRLQKEKKTPKADNKKLINQRKREYQKREIEGSELVVNTPGSFIGVTSRGIAIKLKGEYINKKPTQALKHIAVTGQGITISSNALQYCVENQIPVDFFDGKGKHYASLLSPVSMDGMLWQQQATLTLEKKIALAKYIMTGKIKNQTYLIKYFHKYHKETWEGLKQQYPEIILRMDECINRVKDYKEYVPEYAVFLMSQEAAAATVYWEYIRLLLHDDEVEFYKRERQGATDLMNSMLNYGYAILYARVWEAILKEKLNPSIAVLHASQPGKPTFVYDVVELFRAQAVDRVVISLIQKGEPLKMNKNLLNEETKRLVIQNILERLNRYEKYRGEEIRFLDIIRKQVKEIASFISGESNTYKPYIAKW
jgi:group II intron reverse transcriptase/maturase/CRISPR-associated endonuclease Cas1